MRNGGATPAMVQEAMRDLRSKEGVGGIGYVHFRGGSGMRIHTDIELLGETLCGKRAVYSHARRPEFADFICEPPLGHRPLGL